MFQDEQCKPGPSRAIPTQGQQVGFAMKCWHDLPLRRHKEKHAHAHQCPRFVGAGRPVQCAVGGTVVFVTLL
jgi:hypothetical protein